MPVLFNFEDVDAISVSPGVTRRALITPERVGSDCIALDRWALNAGSRMTVEVGDTDLAWFQLLEGSAILDGGESRHRLDTDLLDGDEGRHRLDTSHVVFLPPAFRGELTTGEGTAVLYGAVPDAKRFDPAFEASRPGFRCVDWRAEPMLDSEHDARKRIYLVTPTLFGTRAVKGEMIIYPPGTRASNHHHEGAEHFQYIVSGSGTALLSEEPHPIRAGDTLYNYEFERHNFVNDGDEDLVFVEYFVPAECRTVWVNPESVCAWLPTGQNIDGGAPARDIGAHSSAETVNPTGV